MSIPFCAPEHIHFRSFLCIVGAYFFWFSHFFSVPSHPKPLSSVRIYGKSSETRRNKKKIEKNNSEKGPILEFVRIVCFDVLYELLCISVIELKLRIYTSLSEAGLQSIDKFLIFHQRCSRESVYLEGVFKLVVHLQGEAPQFFS